MPTLLFDASDGIATLTLHRPEQRNAYTTEMGDAIVEAFAVVREDESIRAVIVCGAGKGFCSGVDLEALRAQATSGAGGRRLGEEDFLRKWPLEMLSFPKPVIAALHGAAVGVGVTMTLPFDFRVAAEGARFALPFVKLGILPGLGSTHLLPRIVGRGSALDLVLSGRTIDAAEALRIGLVQRVVPEGELAASAREIAMGLAECQPGVLAAARRLVCAGAEVSMEEAMANEQRESRALREKHSPGD